jgi:hypothetical protein
VLRECPAIREEAMPGLWVRSDMMSQLGGALLGQGRLAEAEPLSPRGRERAGRRLLIRRVNRLHRRRGLRPLARGSTATGCRR